MEGVEEELDQSFLSECGDIPDTLGGPSAGVVGDAQMVPMPTAPPIWALTVEALDGMFYGTFEFIADMVGEGGEFWQLREKESLRLANAWHPVLAPLYERWGESRVAPLIFAATMTAATFGPRLRKERQRREHKRLQAQEASRIPASSMAFTETATSGATPSSQGQPEAEKHSKPIDWLEEEGE